MDVSVVLPPPIFYVRDPGELGPFTAGSPMNTTAIVAGQESANVLRFKADALSKGGVVISDSIALVFQRIDGMFVAVSGKSEVTYLLPSEAEKPKSIFSSSPSSFAAEKGKRDEGEESSLHEKEEGSGKVLEGYVPAFPEVPPESTLELEETLNKDITTPYLLDDEKEGKNRQHTRAHRETTFSPFLLEFEREFGKLDLLKVEYDKEKTAMEAAKIEGDEIEYQKHLSRLREIASEAKKLTNELNLLV